jgi:hypothetical protein
VAGKKKSETRPLADLGSVYSLDLNRVDYPTFVGLWLNLDRQQLRQAANIYQGISLAFSRSGLPSVFWDAIAGTPEEAEDLEFKGNTEREKQAAFEDLQRGRL